MYFKSLKERPLLVTTVTTGCMMALGDSVAQFYEHKNKQQQQQQHQQDTQKQTLNINVKSIIKTDLKTDLNSNINSNSNFNRDINSSDINSSINNNSFDSFELDKTRLTIMTLYSALFFTPACFYMYKFVNQRIGTATLLHCFVGKF